MDHLKNPLNRTVLDKKPVRIRREITPPPPFSNAIHNLDYMLTYDRLLKEGKVEIDPYLEDVIRQIGIMAMQHEKEIFLKNLK